MSETINQLPILGIASPTDLVPVFHNGSTWAISAIALEAGLINPPYFYNVKSYGALGNGTTDDTAAINLAFIAVSATGGVVYFPPGLYLVSSTLSTGAAGVTLMGAGAGASQMKSAGSPTVIAPTVFYLGGNFSNIVNMGFIGNNVVPPAPPPIAPPVLLFQSATSCKVINCYFTNNTGDCIDFIGITDGEITGCNFTSVGSNAAGPAENTLATPAVLLSNSCVGARVHHNYFTLCQYHGVRCLGTGCEISYNTFKSIFINAIRIGSELSGGGPNVGNGTVAAFNFINGVTNVSGQGGTGIYASDGASNLVIHGNVVSNCDNDGTSFAKCQQYVVSNNVVFNCCAVGGDCGFQYNPQGANNNGATFIGNVSYDNRTPPSQICGLRALGPGATSLNAIIVGNNFNGFDGSISGTPQRGINATDGILADDTNVVAFNTDWIDRQHLGAPVTVPASTTNGTFFSTTIEKGELGLSRGIRMTAFGSNDSGTTGSLIFYVTFGSSLGNILTETIASPVANANFRANVILNNGGASNFQTFSIEWYYNDVLVDQINGGLSVDTTVDQTLTFSCTTPAGDTVVCQACNVERL